MTPLGQAEEVPAQFRRALASLRGVRVRPEVLLEEMPAPERLAPYAVAYGAVVRRQEVDLAAGRLVVLYDPDGQPGWDGTFRIVVYLRADLELEIVDDPLLGPVCWSWLAEALDAHGADHTGVGGTVTRVASESFGALGERPITSEVELRASWTPVGTDLAPQVEAWCEALCASAGLPPVPPGVAVLPAQKSAARRSVR